MTITAPKFIQTPLSRFPGYKSCGIDNAAIDWQGRWTNNGTSMQCGYNGARFTFTVTGTSSVIICADIVDSDAVDQCIIYPIIDNSAALPVDNPFTSLTEIFTGKRFTRIDLPDTGTHTLTLHSFSQVENQFYQLFTTKITDIYIQNAGTISPYTQGSTLIQTIGDSWMASYYDWSHLIDLSRYKLYSITAGKQTSQDMDSRYLFNYDGVANTSDTTPNAIIFSSGVNDLGAGITQANFQTYCLSLVDKIQARYPTIPIFLVRVCKNVGTGNDYGKYGVNMSNVAGLRSHVTYIDTTSLDAAATWESGGTHLDATYRQTFANFINAALVAAGI